MFEGVSDTVHFQTEKLCPPVEGKPRYYRLQVKLEKLASLLDDIDKANAASIAELRRSPRS